MGNKALTAAPLRSGRPFQAGRPLAEIAADVSMGAIGVQVAVGSGQEASDVEVLPLALLMLLQLLLWMLVLLVLLWMLV